MAEHTKDIWGNDWQPCGHCAHATPGSCPSRRHPAYCLGTEDGAPWSDAWRAKVAAMAPEDREDVLPYGPQARRPKVQGWGLTGTCVLGDLGRELVVSRFREDLAWLDRLPAALPVVVYDKGGDARTGRPLTQVVPLVNRGREADTILRYFIDRYDSLPDLVLTSQGDPFGHCDDFVSRLGHDYTEVTSLTTRYADDWPTEWIKVQDLVTSSFGHEVRYGDANIQVHPDLPRWFPVETWDLLFSTPLPDRVWFGYAAQFAIPRGAIRCRSREYWQYLLTLLDSGAAGQTHIPGKVTPWGLEATWKYLLDPSYAVRHQAPVADQDARRARLQRAMTGAQTRGCGCGRTHQ